MDARRAQAKTTKPASKEGHAPGPRPPSPDPGSIPTPQSPIPNRRVSRGVLARARRVRLLALDVDGVLTGGHVVYTGDGGEMLAFDIQDGLGVKLLLKAGIGVAFVTGRRSEMVARRARELGVADLFQGVEDKLAACERLCEARGLDASRVAWMGDDLPDLPALQRVGLALSVPDAAAEVRAAAHYVTRRAGGRGAVREVVEVLLRAQGRWEAVMEAYR